MGESQQGVPLPESSARVVFQQLISAVDYCHRLGVVSRDIKVRSWAVHCAHTDRLICPSPTPPWYHYAYLKARAWAPGIDVKVITQPLC